MTSISSRVFIEQLRLRIGEYDMKSQIQEAVATLSDIPHLSNKVSILAALSEDRLHRLRSLAVRRRPSDNPAHLSLGARFDVS